MSRFLRPPCRSRASEPELAAPDALDERIKAEMSSVFAKLDAMAARLEKKAEVGYVWGASPQAVSMPC